MQTSKLFETAPLSVFRGCCRRRSPPQSAAVRPHHMIVGWPAEMAEKCFGLFFFLHEKNQKPNTAPCSSDREMEKLTLELHVADVTEELPASYSDFGAGFRAAEVGLAVETLRGD